MIQKEYTELAGELELTVSELMAARDRIGKLLLHLDRCVGVGGERVCVWADVCVCVCERESRWVGG